MINITVVIFYTKDLHNRRYFTLKKIQVDVVSVDVQSIFICTIKHYAIHNY